MSNGRKPDYNLWMSEKNGRRRSRIGCAWWNSKQGLSLDLTPGVVLSWRDMGEYYITLWPAEKEDLVDSDQLDLDNESGPILSTKYDHDDIPF